MPGIFGYLGSDAAWEGRLRTAVRRVWPDVTWWEFEGGVLTGHAHAGDAVVSLEGGRLLRAVDGEVSSYEHLPRGGRASQPIGVWAELRPQDRRVEIYSDPAGRFPIYYAQVPDGILFSSLQHVLAQSLRAPVDTVGTLEYTRFGAYLNGRSAFEGIGRLLSAQKLIFTPAKGLKIQSEDSPWKESNDHGASEAARHAWDRLGNAIERGVPAGATVALMMSAGWDSRTLLAALDRPDNRINLSCYSHGDVKSREIRIARRLAALRDLPHRIEPIDERVMRADIVDAGFQRTECLIFPYWIRAGRLLRESGVDVGCSGVLGEVLGGHYGAASALSDAQRALAIARDIVGIGRSEHFSSVEQVRDSLLIRGDTPWYVDQKVINSEDYRRALNEDIEQSVETLVARGVRSPDALAEAFRFEFRGAQYIGAQNLSLRAWIDIANPFACPSMLAYAASVPRRSKIHNRVNRHMLRRHAPDLLRLPLAATLIRASAPLLVQEASRAVRKLGESRRLHRYFSMGSAVQRPKLSWVDFSFFGDRHLLERTAAELSIPFLDDRAMRKQIERAAGTRDRSDSFHSLFDQLGKLRTVARLQRVANQ